ncbi:MAG: transglycosylase domain-containing protein [Saprospiraceae bacterium]
MDWQNRAIRRLWKLSFFAMALIPLVLLLVSLQNLPTFDELENPKYSLASEIYASDGQVIDKYYIENRVPVPYSELSPYLVQALISTEDSRFYNHSGVDFEALARVVIKTAILGDRSSGGGSTISQQLAKLLYPRQDYDEMWSFVRPFALVNTKLKEWITAIKLEKSYTKEEIIEIYLNQFDFINGAYGVQSASETYFGKPQKELNIEEAAVLIGMLKNPSLYNPMRWRERVENRRTTVLMLMKEMGYITQSNFDSLKVLPLDMSHFKRQTRFTGKAPYFTNELSKEIKKILDSPDIVKTDGTKYNLYKDGLKIYTPLDLVIQKTAEEAVYEHMADLQKTFNQVWKGKDPWTYEAENWQLDLRQAALLYHIRNSDRYQNARARSINKYLRSWQEEYKGVEFNDKDLDRLVSASKDKKFLKNLLKRKYITDDEMSSYEDVIDDSKFKTLLSNWSQFQADVKKEFDTPIKMTVFDYNKSHEKDATMTPLDSIKYHRMFLQAGVLAMDPRNGQIKAWVGGIDHKYFQYDHIRFNRQVGSTFKPFVYATAVALQYISPCTQVVDKQYTIEPGEGNFQLKEPWNPGNSTGGFSWKKVSLYEGLSKSINSVSVFLMKQLGDPEPVRGLVHNMGIDSTIVRSDGQYRLPKQPSICLGSADLSVFEMTGAYATFANNGIYRKPIIITKIVDRDGKVIYEPKREDNRALPPTSNYVMVDMLKYNMRGAGGFSGVKSEMGGKTGTTNDYVDGWFMGITPSLVVGTWVGGDDKWVRFQSLTNGQGSVMARPIFAKLLYKLERSTSSYDPSASFVVPKGELGIETDCYKYMVEHGLMLPEEPSDSTLIPSDSTLLLKPENEEEFFNG